MRKLIKRSILPFGTNVGFGGNNQADCHMDGIIKNPTLYLDDKLVMLDGVFRFKENFQLLLEYFLHEIIFTKQERKDV